jgi:hypothetical protein
MTNSVTTITTAAASGNGTTATLTFATQAYAPFAVGQQIVVTNLLSTDTLNTAYQGTYTVTACTTHTVQYNSTAVGVQTSAGTITANLNPIPIYQGNPLTVPSNGTGVANGNYPNGIPAIKIKESDRAAYNAVAGALQSQTSTTVGGVTYPGAYVIAPTGQNTTPISGSWPVSSVRTAPWAGVGGERTVMHSVTVSFPSALAAQYFFNTGSVITFTASQSDSSTPKNLSWYSLLRNMGTITFSNTGCYSSLSAGVGTSYGWSYFVSNKTTQQTIFTDQISGTYSPNQYDILCSLDTTGTVLTFQIQFQDTSHGTGNPLVFGDTEGGQATGTLTSTVNITYASGPYVSVSPYLPAPSTIVPLTS